MAPEEIFVLDASVVVKWFNPEPLREKALQLRRKFLEGRVEIEVPSLLIYEVANALRYNPRFGIEEVKSAMKALEGLQMILHEFRGELADASVETAYRLGITLYDACYVALAHLRQAVLYTADTEVVGKASSPRVRHLSELRAD